MNSSRLEQLKKYMADDPRDPFNLYALALEYLPVDEHQSWTFFEKLLKDFPEYLPTYYHAAKWQEQFGQREQAMTIYKEGISLAQRLQNKNTLRELQSAYNELLFEE